MKSIGYILMAMLLCVVIGCAKSDIEPKLSEEGMLTVVLNATASTRATVPGDGDIYSGGGMEDLTLILVNSTGNISELKRISSLTGDEQRIKRVTFANLDVGNYMLYAYANVERAWLSEVKDMVSALKVGEAFSSARYNAVFTSLTNRNTPVIDDTHPLLLTASRAVSVGVENSSTTIDMLRPVVWFEVRLYNHSEYPMQINDVSFSNFNPSTSYVLPKDGLIPTSVTYRGLPLYETYSGGNDIVVPADTEGCIYEVALFENRAPSYTMSLAMKVSSNDMQNVSSVSTAESYALRNRSTGRYLVDNGDGELELVATLDDAISKEHAMWQFSSSSSGYIKNVATQNRFYRSTDASTSGSNLSFAISSGYLRISYKTGGSSTYYLRDNSGNVTFGTGSGQTRDWILQQPIQQEASMNNSQINVVDMQTAAVTPMIEQLRNQHIKIVVNAYYNDTDGKFNFVVVPWEEKSEEVEFN